MGLSQPKVTTTTNIHGVSPHFSSFSPLPDWLEFHEQIYNEEMVDFHMGKKVKISKARLKEYLDFEFRILDKMRPLPDGATGPHETGSVVQCERTSVASGRNCCTLYGDMLS